MSSLCAVWTKASEPPAQVLLESMLSAQAALGPERSFSCAAGRNVALGGNLMPLLPEDRFDRQPLWSADGNVCLVSGLRLDNRAELAGALGLQEVETLADADILLAAWMRWEVGCLQRLVGGFAFAVWSEARQELFAARDHTGERSIFYHRGKDMFALASMPKGLLALPGVFRGFDEGRLADALALSHPDWNKTYFEGIERLPPAHFLRVGRDSFELQRYWNPCDVRPTRLRRENEILEALLEVFDSAVEARLRSPRGIGAQLSSGLDSSSVTASAARLLGARGERLTAFTSVPRAEFLGRGLPGRLVDEAPGAREVAALYSNVDHVLVDTAGGALLADMNAWTDAMDEPAQNGINLMWILAILRQARDRGLGVMLAGTAGNATISFESGAALSHLFRRGRWIKLFNTARALRSHGDTSYKGAALHATNGLLPMWVKRRLDPTVDTFTLDFTAAHPELIAKYKLYEKTFGRMYADLPSLRQDRAEMFERFDAAPLRAAARALTGVDVRDPTADKRVFEFCYSLPIGEYVRGGHSRSLVRRGMKGRLPHSTLARYQRGQQGADWYLSVAEACDPFREELALLERCPSAQRVLDLPRLRRLLATWPAGGYETAEVTDSWNYALSRGIAMGYFLRTHEAGQPAQTIESPAQPAEPVTSAPSVAAPAG